METDSFEFAKSYLTSFHKIFIKSRDENLGQPKIYSPI